MSSHPSGLCVLALALLHLVTANAAPVDFLHGVASGDPLPSSVIIWTRVTNNTIQTSLPVTYHVAGSFTFTSLVKTGTFLTTPARDFTVKVDVTGLQSGTPYFYRFLCSGSTSPVGNFTLPYPQGDGRQQHLRYAVFSSSNWGWGYFNGYYHAAQYALDFWVHLGGLIYEYGTDTFPSISQAVRTSLSPTTETVLLDSYRLRHKLYRTDAGLQTLSAAAPMIPIWDDHEIALGAWTSGAVGHNTSTEGTWSARVLAAIQAYHEWTPIRTANPADTHINRTLHFGKLASLFMTEGRLTGRTAPASIVAGDASYDVVAQLQSVVGNLAPNTWTDSTRASIQQVKDGSNTVLTNANRKILGDAQMTWLESEVNSSAINGSIWQLISLGSPLHDLVPRFNASIAAVLASATDADKAIGQQWQAGLDAATYGNSTANMYMRGTACYRRSTTGQPLSALLDPNSATDNMVLSKLVSRSRAQLAASMYGIITDHDTWQGFATERTRLRALGLNASNLVFHSGSPGNDFAGIHLINATTVAGAELGCGAATAPGLEETLPLLMVDLLASSLVEGAKTAGLRYAQVASKGFLLVDLGHNLHHSEYIKAEHCTTTYSASCTQAFNRYTKLGQMTHGAGDDLLPTSCMTDTARTTRFTPLDLAALTTTQAKTVRGNPATITFMFQGADYHYANVTATPASTKAFIRSVRQAIGSNIGGLSADGTSVDITRVFVIEPLRATYAPNATNATLGVPGKTDLYVDVAIALPDGDYDEASTLEAFKKLVEANPQALFGGTSLALYVTSAQAAVNQAELPTSAAELQKMKIIIGIAIGGFFGLLVGACVFVMILRSRSGRRGNKLGL